MLASYAVVKLSMVEFLDEFKILTKNRLEVVFADNTLVFRNLVHEEVHRIAEEHCASQHDQSCKHSFNRVLWM